MKRGGIVLLFISLALIWGLVFTSVWKVTGFLLRLDVRRQQLLNYELSSRLLAEKVRSTEEDFDREVEGHVLETTVLNFASLGSSPGPWETGGIALVNGVRLVSGKGILHVSDDESTLRLLQYAFALERTKKLKEAEAVFETIRPSLQEENLAFALLHGGYCKFLLGEDDKARDSLTKVVEQYPGTHFAASARTLLALLNTKREDGESAGDSAYRLGRYAMAAREYSSMKSLTDRQQFKLARSLEETGKMPAAVDLYRKLASGADPVRKDSIRRLLILGTFLGGGEPIRSFATEKARESSDPALQKIEEARALAEAPKFLGRKNVTAEGIVAELKRENPAIRIPEEDTKEEPPKVESKEPPAEKRAQVAKPAPAAPTIFRIPLIVRLNDGRAISCNQVRIHGSSARLIRQSATVETEVRSILSIESTDGYLTVNDSGIGTRRIDQEENFFIVSGARRAYIPTSSLQIVEAR